MAYQRSINSQRLPGDPIDEDRSRTSGRTVEKEAPPGSPLQGSRTDVQTLGAVAPSSWSTTDVQRKFHYETDYYTGTVVCVYFGDIWIDDISFINFTASTPKVPVYSYTSDTPKALLNGNSIVQGIFAINFKEAAYLEIILNSLVERKYRSPYTKEKEDKLQKLSAKHAGYLTRTTPQSRISPQEDRTKQYQNFRKSINTEDARITRQTIEEIRHSIEDENSTGDRAISRQIYPGNFDYDQNKDLRDETGLGLIMGLQNDQDFESLAETLETKIWASGAEDTNAVRVDKLPPFDIYIVYGDIDNQFANHTVRKLSGVRLVSNGQQIQPTGEPIQEAYSFIARDYR